MGVVVCLYLLVMAAVFGLFSHEDREFARHAARTEGTVVALVARAPAGSTREPTVGTRTIALAPKVTYSVGGNTYTYTAAHGRYHQRIQIGDQLQVIYDPSDPSVARLKGEGNVLVPGITMTFALAAVLVALILFRTRRLGIAPGQTKRRGLAAAGVEADPLG
jgi:hypothetical protein